mgnify:CR=1 FL=1
MFCPKCGAKNPDDASFCTSCGAKLGAAPAPAKPTRGKAKAKAEDKAKSEEEGKAEVKAEVKAEGEAESSTGMQPNTAGLLCYLGWWITGIIFVVIEKKSRFVKFHAWQSIMALGIMNAVLIIISIISLAAWSSAWHGAWQGLWTGSTAGLGFWRFVHVLGIIVWILTAVLWIVLMVMAVTGKMWKLPWIGNWAERQARKGIPES